MSVLNACQRPVGDRQRIYPVVKSSYSSVRSKIGTRPLPPHLSSAIAIVYIIPASAFTLSGNVLSVCQLLQQCKQSLRVANYPPPRGKGARRTLPRLWCSLYFLRLTKAQHQAYPLFLILFQFLFLCLNDENPSEKMRMPELY